MDQRPHARQDPVEGPTPRPLAVAPHDRRVDRAAWLVVALVALAVVKPWAPPAEPATGPVDPEPEVAVAGPVDPEPGSPPAPGAPTPALAPARSATPAFPCYWPTGWRLVVLDRELGRTVRTWIAATPTASTSPADPSIRWISLSSPDPIAVGFCAPAWGPEAPAWTDARPRIRQAWRLATTGAGASWRPVVVPVLGDTGAVDLDTVRTPDGGAYAVLARFSSGGPGGAWRGDPGDGAGGTMPGGRYVVAVGPAGGTPVAWFGFDVGSGATAAP